MPEAVNEGEAARSTAPVPQLPAGPLLDHLEKTLADNYRKEIDQEENVWRSLPFFAATLALQLAAIVGLAGKLPPLEGATFWWVVIPLMVAALATLAALLVMAAAIAPAPFRYIAPEPDLRDYALRLAEAERAHPEVTQAAVVADGPPDEEEANGPAGTEGEADTSAALEDLAAEDPPPAPRADAISVFKGELARQYGLATHHNRLINQGRARRRSIAGLCMLAAVLATLVLVGVTIHHHIEFDGHTEARPPAAGEQDHGSGARPQEPERRVPEDRPEGRAGEGHSAPRPSQAPASPSAPPSDARGPQGMVGEQRAPGDGGRVREGGP